MFPISCTAFSFVLKLSLTCKGHSYGLASLFRKEKCPKNLHAYGQHSCMYFPQEDDAKALKESYAKAQQVAEKKAAEFDKVRDAARALNKELNDKSRLLKEQEAEVARLAVNVISFAQSWNKVDRARQHISTSCLLLTHKSLIPRKFLRILNFFNFMNFCKSLSICSTLVF